MTQSIADYTDEQVSAVQTLINNCYGEETELHLGDSEVKIDPGKKEVFVCPVIYWNARECNFVIIKSGEDQYRARYFYTPHDQVSTQQTFFTVVEDCADAVLREQSDDERESGGVSRSLSGLVVLEQNSRDRIK
jgi:hypothetical protein